MLSPAWITVLKSFVFFSTPANSAGFSSNIWPAEMPLTIASISVLWASRFFFGCFDTLSIGMWLTFSKAVGAVIVCELVAQG